jgi:hypothetical protein
MTRRQSAQITSIRLYVSKLDVDTSEDPFADLIYGDKCDRVVQFNETKVKSNITLPPSEWSMLWVVIMVAIRKEGKIYIIDHKSNFSNELSIGSYKSTIGVTIDGEIYESSDIFTVTLEDDAHVKWEDGKIWRELKKHKS